MTEAAQNYRITELAREFGLSRSTLLHYDRIGLLSPALRSDGNYRLYSMEDRNRLAEICRYRRTGMPLQDIAVVLNAPERRLVTALQARLATLNRQIQELRGQQQVIARMLANSDLLAATRFLDRQRWTEILRAAGLDEEGMRQWHRAFERMSPEAHQDFLESLGIAAGEISLIRRWATLARANEDGEENSDPGCAHP